MLIRYYIWGQHACVFKFHTEGNKEKAYKN